MKAIQIKKYAKNNVTQLVDIPKPLITPTEVLVQVATAAVNPLDAMNLTGEVRLVQHYAMPLTLGNELSGVVTEVGRDVTRFKVGDRVYGRLPKEHIGAFAEFIAVSQSALSKMPSDLSFRAGAAVPLTGLTAYQALHEQLNARAGQTLFIPGGSGSVGQMAIPIAKSMGLTVIVSGNAAAKERTLNAGADRYLDYRTENYWEVLNDIDLVIDTRGGSEFDHELAILKPGGQLLSLITGPNAQFGRDGHFPWWKRQLFKAVGKKYDKKAAAHQVTYQFIFVRADGQQLDAISQLVEKQQIVPAIDPHQFSLENADEALALVKSGHLKGKVVLTVSEPEG